MANSVQSVAVLPWIDGPRRLHAKRLVYTMANYNSGMRVAYTAQLVKMTRYA